MISNKIIDITRDFQNKGILLISNENFIFQDFCFPFYFIKQNILLLLDENDFLTHYDCIGVDKDLSFIITNNKVKGIIIENALQKVGLNLSLEQLLEILPFYTDDFIDKMDNSDDDIKNKLIRLYCHEKNKFIKEIYCNFLEVYYSLNPSTFSNIDKFPSPYKTHNGHSFTKEEWEAYEAEEYKKYIDKCNKKTSSLFVEENPPQGFALETNGLKEIKELE